MKNIIFIIRNSAMLVLIFLFIGCSNNAPAVQETQNATAPTATKEQPKSNKGQAYVNDGVSDANALMVAKSIDDFSTLVVAIEAAGVENSVVNAGPLTIFAPLNSAFAKLPEGTVETLLKPENKAKLSYILVNHVAPSNYPISQLKKSVRKGRKVYMASGEYVDVELKDDTIYVGGTKILKSVKVTNGWIHVIDDLILPKE